ncbi:MAG: ATP-dependent Clp protease proteolytic subunit, partial [Candidatus Aminicenantes bacterium]|nr:ATP-dependent Clp protease proteolytic subunit [Candidatus Aminicenantes bacterium]
MKSKILVIPLILLLTGLSYGAIIKITVDAPIHPITSEYIRKSLEKADNENASMIIITLNTPGGLDSSMREIIESILHTETPVVAYVSPSGARAASAGFFIGIACDLFVMAPGTNTGAAHPVGVGITGQQMDETMAEKVTHDAASYIKTIAEKRGRNIQMAEDAVRKSLSYTEKEAYEGNLIEFIANSEQEIIDHFDGKTITKFDGRKMVLALKGETIAEVP